MTPEFSISHHEFTPQPDLLPKNILPPLQNFVVYDRGMVEANPGIDSGAEHQGAILIETEAEADFFDLKVGTTLIGGIEFIRDEACLLEKQGHIKREGLILQRVSGTNFLESPQGQLFHFAKK